MVGSPVVHRQQSDLEAQIARAVANGELVLHYQPIVDVISMDVRYYEALVRWDHEERGRLQPNDFIPLAETSDLICDVDAWVLGEAARQLSAWRGMARAPVPLLAVNISGRHLNTDRVLVDVTGPLERHGLDASQLILEITETSLVADGLALENLRLLSAEGVRLSLDDFGTGYSATEQLSRLPVDIVKIARRYLDVGTPSVCESLVLMVEECQELGLHVVGEGVERADQLAVLRELQVESAQGFLLGRPVTAAALEECAASPYGGAAMRGDEGVQRCPR